MNPIFCRQKMELDESNRIEEIKRKLEDKDDVDLKKDLSWLLHALEEKNKTLIRMKKKNEILHNQNLELTQEMEMIRSDFGGEIR